MTGTSLFLAGCLGEVSPRSQGKSEMMGFPITVAYREKTLYLFYTQKLMLFYQDYSLVSTRLSDCVGITKYI